jgi:hypothetical protein
MTSSDLQPTLIFSTSKSPQVIDAFQVVTYFKYDSGSKEFKPISGNK